ncbi:MAG: hypothetical protein ABWY29_02770 [Blastococcus sp.]
MSEGGTPGPPSPADFAGQLRAAADRIMAGWTAASTSAAGTMAGGSAPAVPTLPSLPSLPSTLSAQKMEAFLEDLAARRAQVQALVTQLQGFDEQLGTLESGIRPFVEWTRTWADLEKTMTGFWPPPSGTSGQ